MYAMLVAPGRSGLMLAASLVAGCLGRAAVHVGRCRVREVAAVHCMGCQCLPWQLSATCCCCCCCCCRIGLSDTAVEGTWRWVADSTSLSAGAWTGGPWRSGFPRANNRVNNCVAGFRSRTGRVRCEWLPEGAVFAQLRRHRAPACSGAVLGWFV